MILLSIQCSRGIYVKQYNILILPCIKLYKAITNVIIIFLMIKKKDQCQIDKTYRCLKNIGKL